MFCCIKSYEIEQIDSRVIAKNIMHNFSLMAYGLGNVRAITDDCTVKGRVFKPARCKKHNLFCRLFLFFFILIHKLILYDA